MSRRVHTSAAAGALGLLALAFTLGGCGSKGEGHVGAASVQCLPRTLDHDARLKGTSVFVSPAPQTRTANPRTQISFLGEAARRIRVLSVVGAHSGAHGGRLRPYSQGDGASFLPDRPFDGGERVTVHALIGGAHNGVHARWAFWVDLPDATSGVGGFPNPQAPPADYQSFRTLPAIQAPTLTITVADRDPGAGDILTTNGPGPGHYGPLIYTPQGQLVWFEQLAGGISAENLSVQEFEGHRDLTFWQGNVLSLGFGQGEDVVMDSHYRVIAKVPGGNGLRADLHDFQLAPHQIAYNTAYNVIRCDLAPAKGPRAGAIIDTAVQETDIRTGLVRWEWHSLDHVAVAESQTSAPSSAPWDWFHLNSIDPLAGGNLLISARSTWASYELEGGTGVIAWRLGGTRSSFHMGPGTRTAWQHDARMLNGGVLTLFDDGSNPPVHPTSRAIRVALDVRAHSARLLSSYVHPGPLLTASQGNMQTLPDGNVVVGYGGIPQVSEYGPSGSLLFDAHLPLEMDSYRAFRFPWTGRPSDPPVAFANDNNTHEETIVRASWNGATEVASWRVLAGRNRNELRARTTMPRSGFESSTILPARYPYVAVQALDTAGRVLGTSRTVAAGPYS